MLFCLQGRYTAESLHNIIDNKEDRTAAAALCESAGGKLVGMFGVMGQDHHIMANAVTSKLYVDVYENYAVWCV